MDSLQDFIETAGINKRYHKHKYDFAQSSKLSFERVAKLLLNPLKQSNQAELISYIHAETSSYEALDYPSKSAFSQSREKLKKELFIDISKVLVEKGQSLLEEKRYKGYRVVAADGTKLYLPKSEELKEKYGKVKNQHNEQCLPVCSILVDVLNGWLYSGQIGTSTTSEKELLWNQLDAIPSNSILLLDRLYPSTELINELEKRDIKYVIRCSLSWNKEVKKLRENTEEKEKQVRSGLTYRAKRNLKARNEESEGVEVNYRIVKIKRSASEVKEIKERLIQAKKHKDAAKVEDIVMLITNLDESEADAKELEMLYGYRWQIETDINILKNKLSIELVSGRSGLSVDQDFYATLCRFNICKFLYNVASAKLEEQNQAKPTKHKRQINMSLTIVLAMEGLKMHCINPANTVDYEKFACDLLLRFTEAVRPNRHVPRHFKANKQRGRIRHDPNFKRVA